VLAKKGVATERDKRPTIRSVMRDSTKRSAARASWRAGALVHPRRSRAIATPREATGSLGGTMSACASLGHDLADAADVGGDQPEPAGHAS